MWMSILSCLAASFTCPAQHSSPLLWVLVEPAKSNSRSKGGRKTIYPGVDWHEHTDRWQKSWPCIYFWIIYSGSGLQSFRNHFSFSIWNFNSSQFPRAFSTNFKLTARVWLLKKKKDSLTRLIYKVCHDGPSISLVIASCASGYRLDRLWMRKEKTIDCRLALRPIPIAISTGHTCRWCISLVAIPVGSPHTPGWAGWYSLRVSPSLPMHLFRSFATDSLSPFSLSS